jgi:hypothetical protein
MMGYGPEDKNAVLELTYNYGVKEYDKGNAYAQVWFLLLFRFCFIGPFPLAKLSEFRYSSYRLLLVLMMSTRLQK